MDMRLKFEGVHLYVDDQIDLMRMVEQLGRLSGTADGCANVCPFAPWCRETETCAETVHRLAYGEITEQEDLQ
ncbi:MAG: hypothetical protein J6S60_03860 [Oscillospiraceae bacterium]|nr:hypothetical protein [Oscillospiraceae bacterium]